MAAGTVSNFTLRREEFDAGLIEALDQKVDLFNGMSLGTIRLVTRRLLGDYASTRFFERMSGIISRRDDTSIADVSDIPLGMGDRISPKLKRRVGPIAQTLDALRQIGGDESEISFILGQQLGGEIPQDYLNTLLSAGVAALGQETGAGGLVKDATDGTLQHIDLIGGLSAMGDSANAVRAWVMHSKPFYDLMGESLTVASGNIAGMTVYEGAVGTVGRPVFVTDSPALVVADGVAADVDKYVTLGLTAEALVATESEGRTMVADTITGKENLIVRFQGEHAFTVDVKGYGWDVANGGRNPADAALATGSNWDALYASNKQKAGVVIESR